MEEPFVPCLPKIWREIWDQTERHSLPTFTTLQNIALRLDWFAIYVRQKARIDVLDELIARSEKPDFDLKLEVILLKEDL